MIASFKDAEAERIYHRQRSSKLPADMQHIVLRKLRMLNNAAELRDLLAPPGNRLEKLKGERLGEYSIRINDQWRICFEWREDGPYNVEIVDYH